MPNIKSAIKRVKVTQTKTLKNKVVKSSLKTITNKFDNALIDNEVEVAKKLYPELVKKIDQATAKGAIHKNAANRRKAKLALRLNAAGQQ
ncbi:MAG TPA: 30S ribosomal protein S20 [Bacillota bacterium]|nr:30S ribosomal protein S20 [Bacillota bacterium]